MGYAVYFDATHKRFAGYGVPAKCDHPDCDADIDRGLSYVCGSAPFGDNGCGLYFCHEHLSYLICSDDSIDGTQNCDRCIEDEQPFEPKPDVPIWVNHMLTDPTWAPWRAENPDDVKSLEGQRN